jgi:hypothetical protein
VPRIVRRSGPQLTRRFTRHIRIDVVNRERCSDAQRRRYPYTIFALRHDSSPRKRCSGSRTIDRRGNGAADMWRLVPAFVYLLQRRLLGVSNSGCDRFPSWHRSRMDHLAWVVATAGFEWPMGVAQRQATHLRAERHHRRAASSRIARCAKCHAPPQLPRKLLDFGFRPAGRITTSHWGRYAHDEVVACEVAGVLLIGGNGSPNVTSALLLGGPLDPSR